MNAPHVASKSSQGLIFFLPAIAIEQRATAHQAALPSSRKKGGKQENRSPPGMVTEWIRHPMRLT